VFTEEKALYEEDEKAAARAKELWQGCIERFPSDPDVIEHALEYYDEQGEPERSIEVLRAALAKERPRTPIARCWPSGLRAAGEPEDAEVVLREAADAPEPVRAVIAGSSSPSTSRRSADYAKSLEAADRAMQRSGELGGPVPPQVCSSTRMRCCSRTSSTAPRRSRSR
jgi:Tfp pilus assembly protein PilF